MKAQPTSPLPALPAGTELRSVISSPAEHLGRSALAVTLSDAATAGEAGRDYIDQPTFVLLPNDFETGTIDVDVAANLRPDAPEYARGFVGIAYHVTEDSFEAVYVRPLNGAKAAPPMERRERAVQYFAFPAWPFDRIRAEFPSRAYEASADIGPDEWMHLHLDIQADYVRVTVDDEMVLECAPLSASANGRIGLWVDIGTIAHFASLHIDAH